LIDDIRELHVKDDERTETFTLEVSGRDGVFHPAGSLSDGTLRFLVLAALAIDPDTKGIICLEEPENGIHPERIPVMVKLLRDIAVDPNFPVDAENPLRQVIINTHSPVVVTNIHPNDLIYFEEAQIVTEERETGKVASPRVLPGTWRATADRDSHTLSIGQLRPYLSTAVEPNQLWLSSLDKEIA
jgi:predicted ATPase